MSLSLASCGQIPNGSIDPALQPLVQSFLADSQSSTATSSNSSLVPDTTDLSASFAPSLDANVVGQCTLTQYKGWINGKQESWTEKNIQISKLYWDNLSALGQKVTMYHELGHCTLSLIHDNNYVIFPDGLEGPESIMNAVILPDDTNGVTTATNYWSTYIQQLFNAHQFVNSNIAAGAAQDSQLTNPNRHNHAKYDRIEKGLVHIEND